LCEKSHSKNSTAKNNTTIKVKKENTVTKSSKNWSSGVPKTYKNKTIVK
jgi:hypothetical protein